MFISEAYAQAAATTSGTESSLMSFLPIILMFVVLYFLMIRPQMKRQREQKSMIEALAKNDEIITSGGILGKVVKVDEAYLIVAIADNTEVMIQKNAVTMLLPKGTIKTV